MNKNIVEIGIIDELRNPFTNNRLDWINQNRGLTEHRKTQLMPLLNKSTENILNIRDVNKGRYVGFVAIRWGFAKIEEGKLKPTEKLDNSGMYDERGQLK